MGSGAGGGACSGCPGLPRDLGLREMAVRESPCAARAGGACFAHAAGAGKPRRGLGQGRGREQITARPGAPASRNEQGRDAISRYDWLVAL